MSALTVVYNPMFSFYKNIRGGNNVFDPSAQGTHEITGKFDGVKYTIDISHTLGSMFFSGNVGDGGFIIQAPLHGTAQLYIGKSVADAFSKSLGNDDPEGVAIPSAFCNEFANEDKVIEFFDFLFSAEKYGNAVHTALKKMHPDDSQPNNVPATTLKDQADKLLLARALVRTWGQKFISNMDLDTVEKAGGVIVPEELFADKLCVEFKDYRIQMYKQDMKVFVKAFDNTEDGVDPQYENVYVTGPVFVLTSENKYLVDLLLGAINFIS
ncbi:hypothetical protein CF8_0020 [Aeromonas phage CF8]|nr:hypothetical protein CF8_0020 [Aeromonas phage CF8]